MKISKQYIYIVFSFFTLNEHRFQTLNFVLIESVVILSFSSHSIFFFIICGTMVSRTSFSTRKYNSPHGGLVGWLAGSLNECSPKDTYHLPIAYTNKYKYSGHKQKCERKRERELYALFILLGTFKTC